MIGIEVATAVARWQSEDRGAARELAKNLLRISRIKPMDYPRIIYPPDLNEWDFRDMEVGGMGGAEVQVDENRIVQLTFIDIPRLIELNKSAEEAGLPCFHTKNLVVLSKLTREKIEETIKYLFKSDYFGSA